MSKIEHQGACLCGAVKLKAATDSNQIGVCHCKMCRRWGGGPLFASEFGEEVSFEGEEHIATFSSSDWAERGFCRTCGTHLFYRLKDNHHYAIPVGLFDDCNDWQFAEQVFIEEKPGFYSFAEDTKELTGEQLFAQYAPD